MKKKTAVLISVCVVILAAAALALYFWNRPVKTQIDQSLTGVLLFQDGREPVSCTVQITGTNQHYLFGNELDAFDGGWEGGILADGTQAHPYVYAQFAQDYAFLRDQDENLCTILRRDLGVVMTEVYYDLDAEQISSSETSTRCLLVAPADSQTAAYSVIEEIQSLPQAADWLEEFSWEF